MVVCVFFSVCLLRCNAMWFGESQLAFREEQLRVPSSHLITLDVHIYIKLPP
jgi:hypothetical protein